MLLCVLRFFGSLGLDRLCLSTCSCQFVLSAGDVRRNWVVMGLCQLVGGAVRNDRHDCNAGTSSPVLCGLEFERQSDNCYSS